MIDSFFDLNISGGVPARYPGYQELQSSEKMNKERSTFLTVEPVQPVIAGSTANRKYSDKTLKKSPIDYRLAAWVTRERGKFCETAITGCRSRMRWAKTNNCISKGRASQ